MLRYLCLVMDYGCLMLWMLDAATKPESQICMKLVCYILLPALALSQSEGSWLMVAGGSWAGRQLWWLQLYYSLCSRAVI